MASNNPPVYLSQVIERRYIKIQVLRNYLAINEDQFGTERHVDAGLDRKITLEVLRELTEDEILAIQKKSYPHKFAADPFALN